MATKTIGLTSADDTVTGLDGTHTLGTTTQR